VTLVTSFLILADQFRMNVAAGPELAAAVTNAGGLGVIGGVGYTPKILRSQVRSYIFFASRCSTEYYSPDVGKAILTFDF
jgi:hypothetical protein